MDDESHLIRDSDARGSTNTTGVATSKTGNLPVDGPSRDTFTTGIAAGHGVKAGVTRSDVGVSTGRLGCTVVCGDCIVHTGLE